MNYYTVDGKNCVKIPFRVAILRWTFNFPWAGKWQNNLYFQGPLIWCNQIAELSSYIVYDSRSSSSSTCSGQLRIYYTATSGSNPLKMVMLKSSQSSKFLDLKRRLNHDSVYYRATVHGNCCWQIHASSYLRGSSHKLELGFDSTPPMNFGSAKAIQC